MIWLRFGMYNVSINYIQDINYTNYELIIRLSLCIRILAQP